MNHSAALPFTIVRSSDVITGDEITSTREKLHGLLRLDGDRLVVQWRSTRTTERVGSQIRTDQELGPVRELSLPLDAIAGARARWSWLRWPPGPQLVLTAADLRAFEALAGPDGLQLRHPAELILRIGTAEHVAAREFAADVELALADRALKAAEARPSLNPGSSVSPADEESQR